IPAEARTVFMEQIIQYIEMVCSVINPLPIDEKRKKVIERGLTGILKASEYINLKTLLILANKAISNVFKNNDEELIKAIDDICSFIKGLEKGSQRIGEILVDEGKITKEDLEETLDRQKPIGEMLVESGKVSKEDLDEALKKQDLMDTAKQLQVDIPISSDKIQTMKINEDKIIQFTNIVGELLIARNAYEYHLTRLERSQGDIKEINRALKENLRLFSRLTNDIHHGVISFRMVPIRGIFQKFTRVVRDISRKQKKLIDLITDGHDVEIDKKIADILSDPLIHIIRNACDHGIETPKERLLAKKPEKGTVILRAYKEGRHIFITVIDDGKGINRQKLYEKAKLVGFPATSPSDPALLDLIFKAGVSTAKEITDISGRGVGMDVVKTTITQLGGTAKVNSEEGKGTQITLSIPMSLGIDTALLVETEGLSYAISLSYIVETLKISSEKIRKAGNTMVFHYRNQVIPAEKLDSLLNKTKTNRTESGKELSMVILNTSRGKMGLIIDRFDKNMEIAIKPVPSALAQINIFSGVSIMGDGKILLVLNPEKLIS
ncbi:MAG: chemotaxis protein CheA, partial [Desulfobacterales bacterium]|nr:chemotaxis protein CheA [Desulfobacterales bacterium]